MSITNVCFGTIWARTFARESQHKKYIAVIFIIRAHRGRDFALGLAGIRELRALEVAPRSSIFWKKRDEFSVWSIHRSTRKQKVVMVRARLSDYFSYKTYYDVAQMVPPRFSDYFSYKNEHAVIDTLSFSLWRYHIISLYFRRTKVLPEVHPYFRSVLEVRKYFRKYN